MLFKIAVVLVVLWLLGLVTTSAMGGFIHILLIIAIIFLLVNFSSGISRFFTGAPTHKAVWMLVGGARSRRCGAQLDGIISITTRLTAPQGDYISI